MNITYEFTDLKLEHAPLLNGNEKVVTRVHYKYRATDVDSGTTADSLGFHNFELVSGAAFLPFAELTQDIVKSWLESAVDTRVLKPSLEISIENKVSSKYISINAPWEPETPLYVAPEPTPSPTTDAP